MEVIKLGITRTGEFEQSVVDAEYIFKFCSSLRSLKAEQATPCLHQKHVK